MTITDKELRAIERNPLNTENARVMARELLAARKVVQMTRELAEGGTGSRTALTKALAAYDKARKGKVGT
jgi:outer membrane protein TolC